MYTRAVLVKRIGPDDWFMLASMVTSVCFLIGIVFQIKYGLGLPVNVETLTDFLSALYITIVLYNVTQTLYKLSITLQSYRLFTTAAGKRGIKMLMGWILICGIFTVTISLFHCTPVSAAWNVFEGGSCIGNAPLNFTITGVNILNDLCLLAIPLFFIRNLQMNEKQRVVLMSIFACGFIISIVSFIRLKALYINVEGPAENQPVTGVDIALWSGLEINIAVICGSLPALKAFVSKVILGKTESKTSGYAYGNNSAVRKQSRALASVSNDDDYKMDSLKINVRESIEMNRYQGDDGGSENDLIIQNQNAFSPAVPMKVKISSAASTARHSTAA